MSLLPSLLGLALLCASSRGAVDLTAAYRAAIEKTEPVAIERRRLGQAQERYDQATGALFPQIALNGRYTRQDDGGGAGGAVGAFTRADQYSVSVGASQAVFRGFAEYGELRRRGSLVRAQRAQERFARATLYRDVAGRYYEVLAAERDRATLRAMRELTEKRLDELRGRVKIGRSRQGELLAAESSAALLTAQIQGAENEVARTREAFRLATGLAADSALADPGEGLPPEPRPVEALVGEVGKRPDLEARQAEVEAADASVTVAWGGHLPSVDVFGNYYLTRTGVLANSKWDVGVIFTFPLFAGGVVQSAVGEAREGRKAAELALAASRRQAEQEVRTLAERLASLHRQVKTLRRAAQLAEQNYRTQNRDYGYGLVTNLEVIQALNGFQETKRVLDRTFFDLLSTRASLDAALGAVPNGGP